MIIGICGLIGSGKGTVADVLVEQHKFKKISFERNKSFVCKKINREIFVKGLKGELFYKIDYILNFFCVHLYKFILILLSPYIYLLLNQFLSCLLH